MTAIGPSDHMRDHWWGRPGWRVGRSMYTWHVTFDGPAAATRTRLGLPVCAESATRTRSNPRTLASSDHAGIGFTDESQRNANIADIADAARKRLVISARFP